MNKKNTRQNKGITLIALIITIIVMLILVSVTITVALNGGLFGYARNAAKETENAINEEQLLASGKIKIDGIWYDSMDDYLAGKKAFESYPIYSTSTASLFTNGVLNENTKLVDGTKTAVIPKGFKVVTGLDSIDEGLVIEDKDGNQFVWIPVEKGTFTRTGWLEGLTTEEFIAKVNNDEYSSAELRHILLNQISLNWGDTLLEDYLYNGGTEAELLSGEGIEDDENSIKEAVLEWANSNYYGDMNECNEAASSDPTGEYSNMLASVSRYGGFYIGRYEAGTSEARTGNGEDGTTDLVVQQGAYPYNHVAWGKTMEDYTSDIKWSNDTKTAGKGAVYLSKNMYTGNDYGVTSTLCYGVQWDAALKFIKDDYDVTDSTDWGNYYNNSFAYTGEYSTNGGTTWNDNNETKPNNTYYLLQTGASEDNKAKNIYDLAGNVWEWTMECYGSSSRVYRGGGCYDHGYVGPAAYRVSFDPGSHYDDVGFRPALYVK